jgi:hypothetical protein
MQILKDVTQTILSEQLLQELKKMAALPFSQWAMMLDTIVP